eukprot:TRINITY_DN30802_c0_g2_i7.p2 TRINITY_DN30802_c0_g2~~TRINITY_DN30802_c0_g2_i7.p2  ORF type:complete len:331 (-),score=74.09 TRINITY_DN30802_c0_g2_i7:272-1264(-)
MAMRLTSTRQHVVVSLGRNALLRHGESVSATNQRKNIAHGIRSLMPVLDEHTCTFVHGTAPQLSMLAMSASAYHRQYGGEMAALDILDAEAEGMVGYLIEQELHSQLGRQRGAVTLLSQIIVDPKDEAFRNPDRFIGPTYTKQEASEMEFKTKAWGDLPGDGDMYRRVVARPKPVRMVEQQMAALRVLTANECIVVCGGGGGIPVIEDPKTKRLKGVEGIIDKDYVASMLATELGAHGLLILTDVPAIALDFGGKQERWIQSASPDQLRLLMEHFPPETIGPKVEGACHFVERNGGWSAIGSLKEAGKIMDCLAGTTVTEQHGHGHLEFF